MGGSVGSGPAFIHLRLPPTQGFSGCSQALTQSGAARRPHQAACCLPCKWVCGKGAAGGRIQMTQSIRAIRPANWGRGRTKEHHFPTVALLHKRLNALLRFHLKMGKWTLNWKLRVLNSRVVPKGPVEFTMACTCGLSPQTQPPTFMHPFKYFGKSIGFLSSLHALLYLILRVTD